MLIGNVAIWTLRWMMHELLENQWHPLGLKLDRAPDQSPCASHGEFRSSRASRIIDPPISLDLQIQNSTNKPSFIPRFWGKRPKEDGQTVRMVNESFHAPPGIVHE